MFIQIRRKKTKSRSWGNSGKTTIMDFSQRSPRFCHICSHIKATLFEGVRVNYCHPGPRREWKGGSEPQSHPPFSDVNQENQESCENHVNSWRLILEQSSYTLVPFSWKVINQKLDFADPFHTFAFPGISRESGKSGKSDGVKTRLRNFRP